MAKKKTKTKGFNFGLKPLILLLVGLGSFGLAFVPAIKTVYDIPVLGTTTNALNFYNLIGEAFKDGVTTEYLIMGIASLVMLIAAGIAVVVSVLWLFGLLNKQSNIIALATYLLMTVALVTYIICFFIFKANATTLNFGDVVVQLKGATISTFVYFLLGLNFLGLAGQILVKK